MYSFLCVFVRTFQLQNRNCISLHNCHSRGRSGFRHGWIQVFNLCLRLWPCLPRVALFLDSLSSRGEGYGAPKHPSPLGLLGL